MLILTNRYNDIVSFEQLGPELTKLVPKEIEKTI